MLAERTAHHSATDSERISLLSKYIPLIVGAVAVDKRAQRRFPRPRLGLDKINAAATECDVRQPDIARSLAVADKYIGQHVTEAYFVNCHMLATVSKIQGRI